MNNATPEHRRAVCAAVRELTNRGQHAAANRLWLQHFSPLKP